PPNHNDQACPDPLTPALVDSSFASSYAHFLLACTGVAVAVRLYIAVPCAFVQQSSLAGANSSSCDCTLPVIAWLVELNWSECCTCRFHGCDGCVGRLR